MTERDGPRNCASQRKRHALAAVTEIEGYSHTALVVELHKMVMSEKDTPLVLALNGLEHTCKSDET